MVCSAAGRLEGHGTKCAFVEDLAVPLLDVAFQQGQGEVDDPAVDAPGRGDRTGQMERGGAKRQGLGPCGGSLLMLSSSTPEGDEGRHVFPADQGIRFWAQLRAAGGWGAKWTEDLAQEPGRGPGTPEGIGQWSVMLMPTPMAVGKVQQD